MLEKILNGFKIECYGVLDISSVTIINKRLYDKADTDLKRAVMFLIPYFFSDEEKRNISLYAVSRDYHLFANELFEKLIPTLESAYTGKHFYGFADNSPIDEREAAYKAGLGIKGDNGLLINKKYGSFCFIAEILTDAELPLSNNTPCGECLHCGKCTELCPISNGYGCLSALTQKKGTLTPDEQALIREYGSVWGCDICQSACPLNENTAITPFEFFKTQRTPYLTKELLENMSDENFSKRAYSWRKRETVMRNIHIMNYNKERGKSQTD